MTDNPPPPPSSGLGQASAACPLRVRDLPGRRLGGRKMHWEVDESEFKAERENSDDDASSRKPEEISEERRSEESREGKLDSSSNAE